MPQLQSREGALRDVPARGPLCHYVIIRSDLPRGVGAAAIVHAAGESIGSRVPDGTHAIVLATPNESALAHVADDLRRAGIDFTAIFEPDHPYDGALMALGLAPRRKEALRRHLSRLPLLK